jgi:hypothetical protein
MLEYLRGRASERKYRLIRPALGRKVWDLTHERGRKVVEVEEQFADGEATERQVAKAKEAALKAGARVRGRHTSVDPTWAVESLEEGLKEFADLFRELFGPLPFRPVAIHSSWLEWKDGTVLRLAKAIYDDRLFGDLPILADALEEAGCTDPDILGHCRSGGEHVRGCWPLDLLLGKE